MVINCDEQSTRTLFSFMNYIRMEKSIFVIWPSSPLYTNRKALSVNFHPFLLKIIYSLAIKYRLINTSDFILDTVFFFHQYVNIFVMENYLST